jgi:hypothetical protein
MRRRRGAVLPNCELTVYRNVTIGGLAYKLATLRL